MGSLCLNSIRFVAVALWAVAAMGWKEPPSRLPTQVRPPDKPPVKAVPVSVLKPAPTGPKFVSGVCPPVRQKSQMQCEILGELHSRLDNPNYWRDPKEPNDFVTWCHEMQHGANNKVKATETKHGLYVGDGKGIIFTHPKVTIKQVANRIPAKDRGKVFDLYLVKQRAQWDNSPIYIIDEALAYYTGCVAHKQLKMGKKRSETYDFAKEMQRYSEILVDTVKALDPTYPELGDLEVFVKWQGERLANLGEP